MPNIIVPSMNNWGNSIGQSPGNLVTDTVRNGEIKSEELLRKPLTDEVEFSGFEKTVRDFILASLGHPIVRVELTDYHIKSCIDLAISKLHYHIPFWNKQYTVFETVAGCNLYEVPEWMANNIEYIVYKKSLMSVPLQNGSLETDMFINYFTNTFVSADFNIGDFYLMMSHLKMMRKILGRDGTFEIINGKYIHLTPVPDVNGEEVIVEYRALNSDNLHPGYLAWLNKYALACAKERLGRVRGKYKVLPGPGGGSQLDGDILRLEAKEEKEQLEAELISEIEEPPFLFYY